MNRTKIFGYLRFYAISREAKRALMRRARALLRRTQRGRAYGALTPKAIAVLEALLFTFANAKDGRCFPGYDRIAEAAGCARSTVARAILMLEAAGLLRWVNRIERRREGGRSRVVRTSNAYEFPEIAARSSKSDDRPGTTNQVFSLQAAPPATALEEALARFARLRQAAAEGLSRG